MVPGGIEPHAAHPTYIWRWIYSPVWGTGTNSIASTNWRETALTAVIGRHILPPPKWIRSVRPATAALTTTAIAKSLPASLYSKERRYLRAVIDVVPLAFEDNRSR